MISLDDQRLLAAVTFPEEWRLVANMPGEKGRRRRSALRKRAMRKAVVAARQKAGESCATCRGYEKGICLPNSDFHGNMPTKPTSICSDWSPRP